jgi:hypothetical protein
VIEIILNSPVGVALVTGLLSVIGIAVAEFMRRNHKALKEVRATTEASREQVQNSHSTNLRDDLDEVMQGVRALLLGQERHTEQIETISVDLAWERRERGDLARRLDTHLAKSAA